MTNLLTNSGTHDIEVSLLAMKQQNSLPQHWLVSTEGLSYRLASLLKNLGYRLGESIHIIRFGSDIPYLKTEFINMPQPHKAMGKTATELLLDIINKKEGVNRYRELPMYIETEQRRAYETERDK